MPKINQAGVPSYDGAGEDVGVVTSATGEQFDLTPDAEPNAQQPETAGQPVDEPREQQDEVQRRDDASSLDLRDQKQDPKTGKSTKK